MIIVLTGAKLLSGLYDCEQKKMRYARKPARTFRPGGLMPQRFLC